MKLKKILLGVLSTLFLASLSFGLASCDFFDKFSKEEEPVCVEHNYVDGRCENCQAPIPSEGLSFELNEDGKSYCVTGIGTCTDTDLVIPATYNNLPVTTIADRAFLGSPVRLTSVVLPDSLLYIGKYAFTPLFHTDLKFNEYKGIYYLGTYTNDYFALIEIESEKETAYTIHKKTKIINDEAFMDCTKLEEITIPDSVMTIGNSAFFSCRKLKKAHLGDGVKYIGSKAFEDCELLMDVQFSNSLISIGNTAFRYCGDLKTIKFPKSLTTIGSSAFSNCINLSSIVIPKNVTTIGICAFSQCWNLQSITVDENNPNYKDIDGNLYSKDGTILFQFALGKKATTFVVPSHVTEISPHAFAANHDLTSIVIPSSITSIGYHAFDYCNSLTSVYYQGTASDWEKLEIGSSNSYLKSATRYYYSETEPTETGLYWHYVNGEVQIWK